MLRLLTFSDVERDHVESTTSIQWQCEEWYIHKAGFITASRCKRVFTRQEAIEKNEKDVTKLVEDIVLPKSPHSCAQNQWNHKILVSGDYFMRRKRVGHISELLAIPTTNWNWFQKAF